MMTATEIKELRYSLGWTQQRLAKYLSVSLPTVGRWENGECTPQERHAFKLKKLRATIDKPID